MQIDSRNKFEIRKTNILNLIVRVGDYETNGSAVGAYLGELCYDGTFTNMWGVGRVKNSEQLFVCGISHAVDLAASLSANDEISLHIFVLSDGFKINLLRYSPKWIISGGLNSNGRPVDSFEEYKRAYLLMQTGGISIDAVTPKKGGEWHTQKQGTLADLVRSNKQFVDKDRRGIVFQGEGAPSDISELSEKQNKL